MRRLLLLLLPLALAGCSGTLTGQLGTAVSDIDNLVPQAVMMKYTALHNLKVGLEQIDATSGMVTMVMPPPTVTTTMPPMSVSAMPPVVTMTAPTVAPSAPTVTNPPPVAAPAPAQTSRRASTTSFWRRHPPSFHFEPSVFGLAAVE